MDFEFPTTVESIDKVPEQFRVAYAEGDDGAYALQEGYKGFSTAVTNLNKSLKAARQDAVNAAKNKVDLSKFSEFGSTVDEIHSSITEKIRTLQEQAAAGKGIDPEKIKADLAKGFQKEREQLSTRAEALQKQLYGLLVENAGNAAIAEEKGVAELLLPFIATQTRTVEEDGVFKVQVIDAAGDVRYSSVTGAPMTIKELVKEMKTNEKFARAFDSEVQTNQGGGGANPAQRRQNPGAQDRSKMSAGDKIAAGLAKMRR